jgi:hypothetical protein
MYRGAGKSLARPTSWCILFDGENISFDAGFVIYIYIYYQYSSNYDNKQNIWKSKSSVAAGCLRPGRAKDLSAPL